MSARTAHHRAIPSLLSAVIGIAVLLVDGLRLAGFEAGPFALGARGLVLTNMLAVAALLARKTRALQRLERARESAETRARDTDERWRLLAEYALDLTVIVGPGGVIRYISPASERLLGYPPEQVAGMDPEGYEHPDDLPKLHESRAQALAQPGAAIGPVTVRVRHRDGRWHWIEVVHRNLLDEPSVRGVVTYCHEVTERVRAEAVLEERERYFRALIEGSYDLVAVVQPDLRVRYASPSAERLTGWRPLELTGINVLEMVHPDDAGALGDVLGGTAGAAGCEARVLHRDGSWRVLEWTARRCLDEPVIGGIVVHARDVTERRRAQDELGRSMRLLEAIIEGATESIFVKDATGRYLHINAAGAAMLGREKAVVIGRTDWELLPRKEATHAAETDRRVMALGRAAPYESSVVGPDGAFCTFLVTKAPWRDAAGRILGVIGIAHDISERKRAEVAVTYARDQALELARLKSEFMANLSHEIRTPINAVIGYADMLLDDGPSEHQASLLGAVRAAASRLLDLVTDVLDLAKIETGGARLQQADMNLHQVVQDAVAVFAADAERGGLMLALDVAAEVPDWVTGDAGRLRQVLINLVGNAVKFTRAGGVTVRVRADATRAGHVHFMVADTGIGIPPDKLRLIFEPFVQGDGSMSRRYGGAGIGLTIACQIVTLLGGALSVDSVEGEGSTFQFTVPLATALIGRRHARPLTRRDEAATSLLP